MTVLRSISGPLGTAKDEVVSLSDGCACDGGLLLGSYLLAQCEDGNGRMMGEICS